MQAKVIGRKKVDFKGSDGPVRMTKYFLTVDTGETDEGLESDLLSWNEIENGPPPSFRMGQDIEVAYNKRGKLRYVEPKPA